MPQVSICIPTYNRPDLLRRAIDSCLAQTYSDYEIIITDNSADDASAKIVKEIGDPRIRYYKNETNLGPFANINRTASLVEGKYVKFLMDDDLLKPRCLELMVAALENNPTAGVVMAPMDIIDTVDRRIFPYFYLFRKMEYRYRYQVGDGLIDRRTILKEFLTRDYPCCVPSGIMWRKECFDKLGLFDPECDFAIDLDLCMRIAVEWDFYYLDQILSSWRYFPANHTATLHQKGLKISAFYFITRKILSNPKAMKLFPPEDHAKIIRDSIFFCSCRALLNTLAALRARSFKILRETVQTIFQEDKYFINKLRLPLFAIREIFKSLFQAKQPEPRA